MLNSIAPILVPLRLWAATAFWWYRTFGLHPLHPDHGRRAIVLAGLSGGVRV